MLAISNLQNLDYSAATSGKKVAALEATQSGSDGAFASDLTRQIATGSVQPYSDITLDTVAEIVPSADHAMELGKIIADYPADTVGQLDARPAAILERGLPLEDQEQLSPDPIDETLVLTDLPVLSGEQPLTAKNEPEPDDMVGRRQQLPVRPDTVPEVVSTSDQIAANDLHPESAKAPEHSANTKNDQVTIGMSVSSPVNVENDSAQSADSQDRNSKDTQKPVAQFDQKQPDTGSSNGPAKQPDTTMAAATPQSGMAPEAVATGTVPSHQLAEPLQQSGLTNGAAQIVRANTAPQSISVTQHDWPATVASSASGILTQNGGTITLNLTPEELGPLRLTMTVEGDVATVQIVTETPEAARILSEAEKQLTAEFARNGLTLTRHDASAGTQSEQRSSVPQKEARSSPESETEIIAPRHFALGGAVNLLA